ncbi:hypothetical protein ABW19_dt0203698 [Dactylella cylindrospora]|nr:hypothetical protein ABW19_dt0203698 [Dactylella cylindrospora]
MDDLEAGRTEDAGGHSPQHASPISSGRPATVYAPQKKPIPVGEVPAGYAKLASFVDLEEDLAIFRRFSRLHARLLLYRQADIEELEEELQQLDLIEANNAHDDGDPGGAPDRSWKRVKNFEENKYRMELVEKLRESMKEYDDELFRYKQKLALKDAAEWQIQNVETWMNNQRPHPLVPTETRFLEDRGDVCALKAGSEDSAVLTAALRSWARDSFGGLSWIFRKKGNPASYGDPSIVYYNTDWKDTLARLLYATLVSVVLVAAVIALFFIDSDGGRLACLCIATFLCGVVMAVFTTAKKGEIMGATAAYCAVLVVFVGSTIGDNKGGSGSMASPSPTPT